MGRCAHRPGGLWFCDLRVRLTKPPQIAEECGLGVRAVRGGHSGCGHPAPAAIGAGFVRLVASCSRVRPAGIRGRKRRDGSSVRPLCGRKRSRPAETPALKGRWAGVPIDPAAYGSCSSAFALRNLHKSPRLAGWGRAEVRGGFASCGRPQQAAIGAGFVRLVASCSFVGPEGARGCTSRDRARRCTWPTPARGRPARVEAHRIQAEGRMNAFFGETWQEFQLMRHASKHDPKAHNFRPAVSSECVRQPRRERPSASPNAARISTCGATS